MKTYYLYDKQIKTCYLYDNYDSYELWDGPEELATSERVAEFETLEYAKEFCRDHGIRWKWGNQNKKTRRTRK